MYWIPFLSVLLLETLFVSEQSSDFPLFAKNTQWIFYPSTLGKYQLDVCCIVIFAIMKLVLLIMHQNQS